MRKELKRGASPTVVNTLLNLGGVLSLEEEK